MRSNRLTGLNAFRPVSQNFLAEAKKKARRVREEDEMELKADDGLDEEDEEEGYDDGKKPFPGAAPAFKKEEARKRKMREQDAEAEMPADDEDEDEELAESDEGCGCCDHCPECECEDCSYLVDQDPEEDDLMSDVVEAKKKRKMREQDDEMMSDEDDEEDDEDDEMMSGEEDEEEDAEEAPMAENRRRRVRTLSRRLGEADESDVPVNPDLKNPAGLEGDEDMLAVSLDDAEDEEDVEARPDVASPVGLGERRRRRSVRESVEIDPRTAMIYFDLVFEDYNYEEDQDSDDPDAKERVADLLALGRGDESKAISKAEDLAMKEIEKILKKSGISIRMNNEGHDRFDNLVMKFGIDTLDDAKKILQVVQKNSGGGDDDIYLGYYFMARGFRLYPQGVNKPSYNLVADEDDWLEESVRRRRTRGSKLNEHGYGHLVDINTVQIGHVLGVDGTEIVGKVVAVDLQRQMIQLDNGQMYGVGQLHYSYGPIGTPGRTVEERRLIKRVMESKRSIRDLVLRSLSEAGMVSSLMKKKPGAPMSDSEYRKRYGHGKMHKRVVDSFMGKKKKR